MDESVFNPQSKLKRTGPLYGPLALVLIFLVVVLVMSLVPTIIQIVSPEFADSLRTGSALYSYVMQMDFLNVQKFVTSLVGG